MLQRTDAIASRVTDDASIGGLQRDERLSATGADAGGRAEELDESPARACEFVDDTTLRYGFIGAACTTQCCYQYKSHGSINA